MSPRSTWLRRCGLVAAGALVTTSPVLLADKAVDGSGGPVERARLAAAGWADLIAGAGGPQLPAPSPTESAIVVLTQPALAAGGRRELIDLEQGQLESRLRAMGGTVTFRYRALVNGLGVRVPTGRLGQVADLPGVVSVAPVAYLLPAQVGQGVPQPLPTTAAAPVTTAAGTAGTPRTIALIDAGIHPQHPSLGGGIGPDRLILGGVDFVSGQAGPEAPAENRLIEAHGTQMAGLVATAPELRGLSPDRMPRLRVYRVMAQERVDGRDQLLARTDRVLAAMDRAADPDQNGDLSDHVSVMLLGMARLGGASDDPLARAAAAADRAGTLVVAPAGNAGIGPAGQPGTVGAPASSAQVLTVGGLASATTPRTATVALQVGPVTTTLRAVPLMGPAPPPDELRTVVLGGADGLAVGADIRDYTDERGQSRVQGALAIVGRGGGTLAQKARAAAQAGAAALAVWDHAGPGYFPGVAADGDIVLPVIGLGAAQGRLIAERQTLRVRVRADEVRAAAPAVASFSGRGPTPDGGVEPDVVAPAVDVLAPSPGQGAEALGVRMSGTSAAAARVAAIALRVMTDDPRLTPSDVRSLIVQSAEPIAGAPVTAQGAGAARLPAMHPLAIEPALIGTRRRVLAPTQLTVAIRELEGLPRAVRLAVVDPYGATVGEVGPPLTLPAGGAASGTVTVPAGEGDFVGRVLALGPDGRVLARVPVVLTRRVRTGVTIRRPVVTRTARGLSAEVEIGAPAGATNGVHEFTLRLMAVDGRRSVALTHPKLVADWPQGRYRFTLTRRDAYGHVIAPGRYRLRVEGLDPAGGHLRATSAAFWIK